MSLCVDLNLEKRVHAPSTPGFLNDKLIFLVIQHNKDKDWKMYVINVGVWGVGGQWTQQQWTECHLNATYCQLVFTWTGLKQATLCMLLCQK